MSYNQDKRNIVQEGFEDWYLKKVSEWDIDTYKGMDHQSSAKRIAWNGWKAGSNKTANAIFADFDKVAEDWISTKSNDEIMKMFIFDQLNKLKTKYLSTDEQLAKPASHQARKEPSRGGKAGLCDDPAPCQCQNPGQRNTGKWESSCACLCHRPEVRT